MKKYFIPLIVLVFLTGASFSTKNVEKEKEAIKKVITEATESYRAKSYERLAAIWNQNESVVKIRAKKNSYDVTYGWSAISSVYKADFEKYPTIGTDKYKKVDWNINVLKNSAWVTHEELHYRTDGQITRQIITHFLEKHNGRWKIVYMFQIFPNTYN